MINIINRADYMQDVSEITANLFGLVTTIVDRNFVRVAGSHHYKDSVGKPVQNHHVFRYVMEKDKCVIIEEPGRDLACSECPRKNDCGKTAAIYAPLKVENKIVGGLAVIAFDDVQKKRILDNMVFFQFVEHLSHLISGKLEAEQSAFKLEDSLRKNIAILNAVHDGVIAVDHQGIIEQINHSATAFFGISEQDHLGKSIRELLPDSVVHEMMKANRPCVDKEVELVVNHKKSSVFLTAQPIHQTSLSGGVVLSFKNEQEITSLARRFTVSGAQPISFDNIIDNGTSIKAVKELARKVAIGNSTVLIRGESGTGKELFARAIHNESLRSNGPFIAVNCAAIPEPLLESELFGYAEGAFTGARRGGKPGKCELAIGGTLFLDEVGDIPLSLQSKFLRMLQERTIERVGGNKTIPIDVRIIAATHRDLEAMIDTHEFREDLYYRLNVIPLVLPPLRERPEDIYDISRHFLNKYALRLHKRIHQIEEEVVELLQSYDWPGNIRELENAIEYAVNVETGDRITLKSLPARILGGKATPKDSGKVPRKAEEILVNEEAESEISRLVQTINQFGWDTKGKAAAATHLGMSTATLYRKLKRAKLSNRLHAYRIK